MTEKADDSEDPELRRARKEGFLLGVLWTVRQCDVETPAEAAAALAHIERVLKLLRDRG